jgi:DNA polymerase elongation subunit (family B)
VKGKYGLEKLIVTKTLNDGYKNPEAIAHKVLADRIGERDPGNKPQLFDRVPFAYVQTKEKNPLQGDRIEHPDYIRQHKLKPDYEFYITNQIMKPISQIFALSILEIPTLKKSGYIYENLEKKYKIAGMSSGNIEKKILAKKQRDVGDHLFSDILLQCDTQKNGNQSITKWFGN